MKHKILISIDHGGNAPGFLDSIKAILNTTHEKFLTGISISNYLEKKLTLNGNKKSKGLRSKVEEYSIEAEINLEHEAKRLDMHFNMQQGDVDDITLNTLSSVSDLLIIDRKVLNQFGGEEVLSTLIKSVVCPVLILPTNAHIDSLVMVHDGTLSSVHAVKHFLGLFRHNLRDLPVFVLVSEPGNKKDIQGEKVFIDYIKMFFDDLGIQMMDDEPVNCLMRNIRNLSQSPMVIAGEVGGNNILNCASENRTITDNTPTFIFWNAYIEAIPHT